MLNAFVYGFILAFSLILPLGVQNIFIFNQGATQRHFLHALPCVIAASLCDTLLIVLAVLGISVVVLSVTWLKTLFFIIGFFFLIYMGWITWHNQPPQLNANKKPLSAKKQINFALSVSLLNPHAIMDSVAVLGMNSLHFSGQARLAYMTACITVSCLWFFGLSIAGHVLHRLDKSGRWLLLINKISALIIWGVAFYFGWQIIKLYLKL